MSFVYKADPAHTLPNLSQQKMLTVRIKTRNAHF